MNCEVIQDLLPLYHDDVLSAESCKIVGEHLQTCERCKETLKGYDEIIGRQSEPDGEQPLATGFKALHRKLRRKTILIAALAVVCTAVLTVGVATSQKTYASQITVRPVSVSATSTASAVATPTAGTSDEPSPGPGVLMTADATAPEGSYLFVSTDSKNGSSGKYVALIAFHTNATIWVQGVYGPGAAQIDGRVSDSNASAAEKLTAALGASLISKPIQIKGTGTTVSLGKGGSLTFYNKGDGSVRVLAVEK